MIRFVSADPAKQKHFKRDINELIASYQPYHTRSQLTRLYAEYKNHGRYGYPGGVLDQPDVYWSDMEWMGAVELWAVHLAPLSGSEDLFGSESVFDRLKRGETL